ncbi:hypothetical protein, partial [Phocaeicola plebeius]|uniref:hypothetical protein n=1 Tax=Phocaeicola plebeius TaxID=310297 RepID=UPI003FD7602D
LTEALRQKRFGVFLCPYCPYVCVRVRFLTFRGRPLLLSAAGFFFSSFSPCFPLLLYRSPGRPSEMRLEAFSPERRVHSSPELSDALKTY